MKFEPLHFEGQNAILLALKVLSNKIDHRVNRLVLCRFSVTVKHYNRTLRNLVSVLVNRCISIQLGDSRPTTHSRLRSRENWQFFFGGKRDQFATHWRRKRKCGQFWRRFTNSSWKRKEIIPEARRYPPEIDLFASEGFLQFFFEDNADNSFNVYLLGWEEPSRNLSSMWRFERW